MSSTPSGAGERSSKALYDDGYEPSGELRWSKRRVVVQPVEEVLGAPKLQIDYTHVLQQKWKHPNPMRGVFWQNVPSIEFKVEDI